MIERYTPVFASLCHSRKCASLPDDACELLYDRCLLIADPWGRLPGDPALIKAAAWPLLEHRGKTTAETGRCRDALIAAGLLELHRDDEHGDWLQIPDWEEKAGSIGKRDHRRKSRWPDPSEQTLAAVRPEPDGRGPVTDGAGPTPGQPSRARVRVRARKTEIERETENQSPGTPQAGTPPAALPGAVSKPPKRGHPDVQALAELHRERWPSEKPPGGEIASHVLPISNRDGLAVVLPLYREWLGTVESRFAAPKKFCGWYDERRGAAKPAVNGAANGKHPRPEHDECWSPSDKTPEQRRAEAADLYARMGVNVTP